MAPGTVTPGTYSNLAATLLETRKQRHREVRSLAQVTQLMSGGAGVGPRLPGSRAPGAPGREIQHPHSTGRTLKPRRFALPAHELTVRAGFEPRSCVLSSPSLEDDTQGRADLVWILL